VFQYGFLNIFFRTFNLFLLMFDFPKQYKENTPKHFDVLGHLIS